jgi:hypothetical protein
MVRLTLFILWDTVTANAVSPLAEVAPATISPIVAKQKGHIASPLDRVAKRDCEATLFYLDDRHGGSFSKCVKKLRERPIDVDNKRLTLGFWLEKNKTGATPLTGRQVL